MDPYNTESVGPEGIGLFIVLAIILFVAFLNRDKIKAWVKSLKNKE